MVSSNRASHSFIQATLASSDHTGEDDLPAVAASVPSLVSGAAGWPGARPPTFRVRVRLVQDGWPGDGYRPDSSGVAGE